MVKSFYYVHTGHRIGLDRFRRAVALLKNLEDEDITLLTSDYRIAQVASEIGIKKSMGIDVVQNIPYLADKGDRLVFDSAEANPLMLDDMRNYFSKFVRISDSKDERKDRKEFLISPYLTGEDVCNAVVVDDLFFDDFKKDIELSYFFGDDDYEKDLERYIDFVQDLDPCLQLGFYYFLDYEESLKGSFEKFFEFEEYESMIKRTKVLITASVQAVLDSLASGGRPVFFQREDYPKDFLPLFKALNVPVVEHYNKKNLLAILETIDNREYIKIEKKSRKTAEFLKKSLNL